MVLANLYSEFCIKSYMYVCSLLTRCVDGFCLYTVGQVAMKHVYATIFIALFLLDIFGPVRAPMQPTQAPIQPPGALGQAAYPGPPGLLCYRILNLQQIVLSYIIEADFLASLLYTCTCILNLEPFTWKSSMQYNSCKAREEPFNCHAFAFCNK